MTAIAITGIGLVTRFGVGLSSFLAGLRAGKAQTAAVGPALDGGTGRDRASLYRIALADALADARLPQVPTGCLIVTVAQTPAVRVDAPEASRFASGYAMGGPGIPDDAMVTCVSQACSSVAVGVTLARAWLRTRRFSLAIVGGAFIPSRYDIAGMNAVGCLADGAVKPFDIGRSGTRLGSGSGVIVLEEMNTALARGARPRAVVAGATVLVRPKGSGSATDPDAAAECLRASLADAGNPPVDYVHAHATGTIQGDEAELSALEQVGAELGWQRVPVGADKGAIGHLMHVSAAPGIAAALGMLGGLAPPGVPGLERPLRPVTAVDLTARSAHLTRVAVVDSFGFGGNNAALVLCEAPGDQRGGGQ
jgi:3-oxoacyl-[acyl-carrier-protein] synthase II